MSGTTDAAVVVEALTLTLGAFRLDGIDFTLGAGEILVVLGPNGAGKSVTLETIAGFHRPEGGRICIGGREITALPPERRNIGFVVQNFGLFPHLTVEGNVAIARRRAAGRRGGALPGAGEPAALLKYFGVAHLAQRMPAALSPGEKQRVALARALAGAAELFLFDEPFSALDGETRGQLRDELKSFLRELDIPAIFVTHDHAEALMLADMVVVLRAGSVVQRGAAAAIFARPLDAAAARMVGVENILDGRVVESSGGMVSVAVGKTILRAAAACAPASGTMVKLAIRAEEVSIGTAMSDGAGHNRIAGTVSAWRHLGPLASVEIDCGFALKAYLLAPQARRLGLRPGDAVSASIAPAAIHVMEN